MKLNELAFQIFSEQAEEFAARDDLKKMGKADYMSDLMDAQSAAWNRMKGQKQRIYASAARLGKLGVAKDKIAKAADNRRNAIIGTYALNKQRIHESNAIRQLLKEDNHKKSVIAYGHGTAGRDKKIDKKF